MLLQVYFPEIIHRAFLLLHVSFFPNVCIFSILNIILNVSNNMNVILYVRYFIYAYMFVLFLFVYFMCILFYLCLTYFYVLYVYIYFANICEVQCDL